MCEHLRIGNQTAQAADDPMTPFNFALAHGFNAFEWFSDRRGDRGFDFDLLDDAQRTALRDTAASHNMRFSVHAPWHADPWREGNDHDLRRSIHFAAAVGAPVVVLHMNPDAPLGAFVDALAPGAKLAHSLGVRIALENTVMTPPEMFNRLFTELRITPDVLASLGVCLDIGHANLHPPTQNNFVAYLDEIDRRAPILHVHAHENRGDADSHLTLFTGPSCENETGVRAVLRRLAARGFDGCIILEQWPEPAELLVSARDRLRELWPSDDGRECARSAAPVNTVS